MRDISPYLANIPDAFHNKLNVQWERYRAAQEEAGCFPLDTSVLNTLFHVWACSDFAAKFCIKNPAILAEMLAEDVFTRQNGIKEYTKQLQVPLRSVENEAQLMTLLRKERNRELFRILWRDLTGLASLEKVVSDLSAMADVYISAALKLLYQWHCEEFGRPLGPRGRPQSLTIIALGKLGAEELNLSSDVDLIFCYLHEGVTDKPGEPIENSTFFINLGRRLIRVLNAQTAEGLVFRVDMRLRPYGNSGPLVMGHKAMETYYQEHGREWERYAFIKARVISGEPRARIKLLDMISAFVYRRYMDYGAIEALREMKRLITREVKARGLQHNIKLGLGGIREVEFITQVFQLMRGGQQQELQQRSLLVLFDLLVKYRCLTQEEIDCLRDAYEFLRNLEHRLQGVADQQTQILPRSPEERLRVAYAMGFYSWDALHKAFHQHTSEVHQHFEKMIALPKSKKSFKTNDALLTELSKLWQEKGPESTTLATLQMLGFMDEEQALKYLNTLLKSEALSLLDETHRHHIDALMPLILSSVTQLPQPDTALPRLIKIVEAILKRKPYVLLLLDHPISIAHLTKLCAASSWLSEKIARYPVLLDEFIHPEHLYEPLPESTLGTTLHQQLLSIPEEALEQQMDAVRRFKNRHVLHVAAADVVGKLPLMRVSDHLTGIAITILQQVLEIIWKQLAHVHGHPQGDDGSLNHESIAIVAYGKLGGIELGYGSDLDLVFLHSDIKEHDNETDGQTPIANSVFYTRLVQRIIHFISTKTTIDALYEIDTRLRPSGASGLLVNSMSAFANYQQQQAWTWEHQALVRARVITQSPELEQQFDNVRQDILTKPRDRTKLRQDILDMRQKMRESTTAVNNVLKEELDSIADIEFIVQYAALRWAPKYPSVITYTDNIRILESLQQNGIMDSQDVDFLCDAYRAFRAIVHHVRLQNENLSANERQLAKYRAGVRKLWLQLLEQGD